MTDTYLSPGSEGAFTPGELQEFEPKLPKVSDEKSYAEVKGGTQYLDPEGKKRFKPISGKQDYEALDEGAQYADPEGQIRTKPKFEPISLTSQTLYDMGVTQSEKRKALERSYPGKVKEDSSGFYVEDDGTLRRPGRGLQAVGGFIGSAAAPTVGTVVGALGGGTTGPVGGALGAVGGALAGQTINDAVLQLAGIYDRSVTEQAATSGLAAGSGLLGFGVGRGVAAAVLAAKAGVSSLGQVAPSMAAKFLGAGAETTTAARQLAEKGEKPGSGILGPRGIPALFGSQGITKTDMLVPPSAWAHEAPHLQNVVEVFDPAFRTNKPLLESATQHYEKSGQEILENLGVKREGSLVEPKAAVPTQAAGEIILQKTLAESAEADRKMAEVLAARKAQIESGVPASVAQREAVTKAAEDERQRAQQLIDASFAHIQQQAEQGYALAKAGASTGDLWENVGNQLIAVRRGIGERAEKMYGEADQLAAGHLPNTQGLSDVAAEFRDQLPGDFKAKHPDVVRKLEELAGAKDDKSEWVKEPVQPTFGQLHNLRSLLRGNADWWTLSSDIRNGTYKYFSKVIDGALHDANAVPELKAAAAQLDRADAFYKANIPIFEAQQIKAIMKGLEAGEPADPANLYKALVKEGQTDLTRRVRDMVGPNLWAGVKAADTDAMLNASKTLNPGEINGRAFAKEVLDRHQRGILEVVHGKEASEQLLAQARAIEQLDGRLSIPVRPDDTMTQVIARARMFADEAKAMGNKDPLKELSKDVKRVESEMKREASLQRRNDPLGFLYNKSTGASYAVDKILGDEDLILAAAARFGEKSPEFNALRQVYVERVLQGTLAPGKKLEKISPEVQQLMFPGVTKSQMEVLAKEMDLLMNTRANLRGDTAGGMSAMAKVEHPVTSLPIAKGAAKLIPGLDPAARSARGKFYSIITNLMTSPTTLRWIEKGLTSGTPEEQEAVRNVLRRHLQKGSAMGAGAGEAVYQEQQ